MKSALALALLGFLGACRASSDDAVTTAAPTAKPSARPTPSARATAGDVTIEGDGKGGYRVRGGSQLKGSARACAAYKSCCSARDLSLFCSMLEATEKDCDAARQKVKSYAAEAKIRLPAGCD
jgi:hypothetical protein